MLANEGWFDYWIIGKLICFDSYADVVENYQEMGWINLVKDIILELGLA